MSIFASEQHTVTSKKPSSSKGMMALLSETYTQWSDHQATRLGASVAFYSILSFAPLLVLITAIIGIVFGHEHAQGAIIGEARQMIGDHGADTVQTLLKNAQKPASGAIASTIAFITLLFGASGVFTELQDAMNLMWDVKAQATSGVMGMIKQRLFSFGMVLSIGFLLLVSLMLSAGLAFVGHSLGQLVPMPPFVLESINFVISFAVITGLFALMFKYVPDAKVSWRNVGVGAVGTAFLFTIGKLLLGIYLGKASIGSTYGAAGSLVAVVVWIYYSAQIFFFGAEFTHVYSDRKQGKEAQVAAGSPAPPAKAVAGPAIEQAPLAVAASAGAAASASSIAPIAAAMPSPTPPVPSPTPTTPNPRPATPAAPPLAMPKPVSSLVTEVPKAVPVVTAARLPSHRTKPELVTSMAIGFLLGRITGRLHRHHEIPGD